MSVGAPAPDLLTLLAPRPDLLVLVPTLLAAGAYAYGAARAARAGQPWPAWRVVSFALGVLLTLLCTQTNAVSYTVNSMALYMGRLMVLAELAPPLLVLGLPRTLAPAPSSALGRALGVLLDPFVTFALWTTIIVFWNLPVGMGASLVSNTAATLLPSLYLLGGLLVWAVTLRPFPTLQGTGVGGRGWFGFLNSLPMMVVAMVWLNVPRVLYSPYVGVPCLWNLTPLQNQQISGWVMMIAGTPALLIAFVQLFAWLIHLADSGSTPPTDPPATAAD
ncbi:cytochrome c oxidase assembly protein [Deinococcus maricopensis]|uniref:Cytochrome c oxidase caa3-type, assembly factor CtaG-related protein n=1 Tax=Deinococcus maricopensis (strain DSM 21211 / LMG 22137 / NRRL B-23946 / LB-34) TaxID=709986 RepID=E8U9R1_DEIML|nr:cytochrome c oxidase assembly protein [Deinococcus maricopensis]ADV67800.1 Cytochrome c oxidase caa3-type, assembly factor CtaG-related protein [Deinococcus maricopensis DSM 21211]